MTEHEVLLLLEDLYNTHRRSFYKSLTEDIKKDNSDKRWGLYVGFRLFYFGPTNVGMGKTLMTPLEKVDLIRIFHFFYPYWVAHTLMTNQAKTAIGRSITGYYARFFAEYPMPANHNIR